MGSTHLVVGALAVAVLAGCAAGKPYPRASDPDKVCVDRRSINAISALDERHAFVKASAADFYLLTMDESCREFELARRIEIAETGARVCGDGATLLSFETPTVGPMRCRIEALEPVASKAEALDRIESRRGER